MCIVLLHAEGQGTRCIPTKARHSLQGSLQADLLQTQVAVPEQTTPEEHPVQASSVIHDDYASLPGNEAITCYHHLHPKYQLQQGLQSGEMPGWREDEEIIKEREEWQGAVRESKKERWIIKGRQ